MADSLKQILDKPGPGSPSLNNFTNPTGDIDNVADGIITAAKVATANKDGTAATASMRTLGTGATQACAGNDSRLSDARPPSATYAQGTLGGDVTLTNVDTWYDGPAVTLSAGTWLLSGQLMFAGPAGNFFCRSRLWDGTNTAVEDIQGMIGGLWGTVSQSCIVVIASGTPSWRMAGYCHSTGCKIYSGVYSNLCAIKIAP